MRAQLDRIAGSATFMEHEDLGALLAIIVDETLQGRHEQLDAAFEHPESRHDLARLRALLHEYYQRRPDEPVLFRLPEGQASAQFEINLLTADEAPRSPATPSKRLWLAAGAAAVAGISGYLLWPSEPKASVTHPVRLQVSFSDRLTLADLGTAGPPALSPDGRRVAFVAATESKRYRLFVRMLDGGSVHPMGGTENAAHLFWSPDGKKIGFFAGAKLKIADVATDGVEALADAPDGQGGTWSHNGTVLFVPSPGSAILRVAQGGGPVSPAVAAERGISYSSPWFLPDGERFLYVQHARGAAGGQVFAADLSGSPASGPLLETGSQVRFALGRLVYARDSELLSIRFDPGNLRTEGSPTLLAGDLPVDNARRAADFSVSSANVLLHRTQTALAEGLAWHTRTGRIDEALPRSSAFHAVELSPDNARIAAVIGGAGGKHAVRIQTVTAGAADETEFRNAPYSPVWSPDSASLFLAGDRSLVRFLISGGSIQELLQITQRPSPTSAAPDGKSLLFQQRSDSGDLDLWRVALDGPAAEPEPVLKTRFDEAQGRISPDGNWIAYVSNESGRPEIYIRASGDQPAARRISAEGGVQPRWRSDGRELYYVSLAGMLIAVPVRPPAHGTPAPLFRTGIAAAEPEAMESTSYTVSSDGKRFLAPMTTTPDRTSWTVVMNWLADQPEGN